MVDLGLIVADKNMDFALRGICSRPERLKIRPISSLTKVIPGRDGGTRKDGPEVLNLLHQQVRHGIVMLDHEGSGSDVGPEELEAELTARLAPVWGDRARAIVIAPELDGWIWGSNQTLKQVFEITVPDVRRWLIEEKGFEFDSLGKPIRPKEALDCLTYHFRAVRSSSNYEKITASISLKNCVDPAFVRLRQTLQRWFSG